jgi:hypothetical protein
LSLMLIEVIAIVNVVKTASTTTTINNGTQTVTLTSLMPAKTTTTGSLNTAAKTRL